MGGVGENELRSKILSSQTKKHLFGTFTEQATNAAAVPPPFPSTFLEEKVRTLEVDQKVPEMIMGYYGLSPLGNIILNSRVGGDGSQKVCREDIHRIIWLYTTTLQQQGTPLYDYRLRYNNEICTNNPKKHTKSPKFV